MRRFFTREESTSKLFLFDAQQLKRARRKRDPETKTLLTRLNPRPACRVHGIVYEALAGESLHAQIRLRIQDDIDVPEAIRHIALSTQVEDGFTMED